MVVKTPAPKSLFVPRAEPAIFFGPFEHVSGSSWLYQHGRIKARTNFQPQGLIDHDPNWVKANLSAWDSPDALASPPAVQLSDASSLNQVVPVTGGAARETATCPACLCRRRKQRVTTPHTSICGQCLNATPPPPAVV